MIIAKTTLQGSAVRLEPLDERHLPGLAAAVDDGALHTLTVTTVPSPAALRAYLASAEARFREGRELAYATIDRASGTVVGSTRFRAIETGHRRVEIGSTFIAASWQRTHVNTQAKLLMLAHAFEHWGCNRVELLTDALNERSRAAIARLGAVQEGVLRQHMVMPDGRVRDSVIFSLTAAEWPAAKARLAARMAAR